MHLLAIFLQYLLGRISNKPQTQPVVVRRRISSAEERQALESSSGFDVRTAVIYQAMRAEQRASAAACRAGPDGIASGLGQDVRRADAEAGATLSPPANPSSAATAAESASPLRA